MGDCATTLQEAGETDPVKSPRLVFSAPGVAQKSRSLSRSMEMDIGGGAYTVQVWISSVVEFEFKVNKGLRKKGDADARLGWQYSCCLVDVLMYVYVEEWMTGMRRGDAESGGDAVLGDSRRGGKVCCAYPASN